MDSTFTPGHPDTGAHASAPNLITSAEAAKILGVSQRALQRMAHRLDHQVQEWPGGIVRLYQAEDVRRYAEERAAIRARRQRGGVAA